MNQMLEQIAQAIFKHWFIDFEFPNEEGKPYKSSGGEMVDSELGEIPKGWKIGNFGDLVNISTGKGLKKDEFKEDGKFSLFGANGIIGKTDKYLFDDRLILTGRVGTLGNVFILNEKVWISDNVLISKVFKNEFFYFAYFTLKRFDFFSLNRGSTQPLITQTDLKNQAVIIPDDCIMKIYDQIASALFSKLENNKKEILTLSSLRDILIPKLISGKIRVKTDE